MNTMRLHPRLGIAAALILWVLVASLLNRPVTPPAPSSPTASSTLSVLPGLPVSPPTTPPATSSTPAPTQTTTTPPQQKKSTPTASLVATQPISAATSAPPPAPSSVNASLDASASALRAALVNILCYVPSGSGLHSVSGSGVIIDSKGLILTNAHVAQYFLLADRGVSCHIRSGSPAVDSYRAKLIFISSAWINANSSLLTESTPSGTGEHDFALLAITHSATSTSLPSSFQSIPLATKPPSTAGAPVVIASYGAQFLDPSQIQTSLFPTLVFGSVKDVLTFGTNTVDVLALGGSAAAQEGSSGGGIADLSGDLIGTITTSTVSGDTSSRALSAITASYIRADYASETGKAFDVLLAEPVDTALANFASQIPALEAILTAHLP